MKKVSAGQCGRHPERKAVFEEEGGRAWMCRQCAVEAVRMNRRVVGVSESRLMLRSLLEQQLKTLEKEQNAALEMVKGHYENMKDSFRQLYQISHVALQENKPVDFAEYVPSTVLTQIPEMLGNPKSYQLLFETEENDR